MATTYQQPDVGRHRPRFNPRLGVLTTLVSGLLLVVACSASEPTPSPSTSTGPDIDLVVTAEDWRFVPSRVRFDAGDTVTVELRNDGNVVHNWVVLSETVESESEYRNDIRLAGVEALPGSVERVSFTVPQAGEYQIICTIPGHFAAGMTGILESSDA